MSIGFDDGSEPFDTVTANSTGNFLAIITLPGRLRAGERRLVASSADGAVANVTIDIEGPIATFTPRLPGYGLG